MVAKPVIVGAVGVIVLASALVLNYFVLPGEESDSATAVAPQRPPAVAAPKPGDTTARPAAPGAPSSKPASAPATAAATPPKPASSTEPSFDVVRVDPDGNTVLAGRGAPNAEIAIMDGGEELGRVTADSRGEWVFIPESKLPPGQRVLFLRQSGAGQKASTGEVSDSVILVIPEKGKDIAGRPASEPSMPLVVVVPKDDAADGGKSVARVLQAPVAGPLAGGSGTQGAAASPAAAAQATASAATAPPAAASQTAAAPAGAAASAGAAPATVAAGTPGASAGGAAPGVASAGGAAPAAGVAAAGVATAGVAAPGEAAPGSAASAATAAGAPSTGTAPAPAEAKTVAEAAPTVSAYPEKPADGASKAAPDKVAVDVIDYDAKGDVVFSGRTDPGARVEVFIDDKKVGDTGADAAGRWTMRPDEPVAPGSYQLRVDKVAASGTVEARVAFPFVRANPLTELPSNRLVVIQPGNNLWRIATRVYGEGVRYVEIFDANKDQILDPDLIYPGQVFGLPRTN